MNVLKRPVLNNIGRFVFQGFKNIPVDDFYTVFINNELVILPFGSRIIYSLLQTMRKIPFHTDFSCDALKYKILNYETGTIS